MSRTPGTSESIKLLSLRFRCTGKFKEDWSVFSFFMVKVVVYRAEIKSFDFRLVIRQMATVLAVEQSSRALRVTGLFYFGLWLQNLLRTITCQRILGLRCILIALKNLIGLVEKIENIPHSRRLKQSIAWFSSSIFKIQIYYTDFCYTDKRSTISKP